MAVNCSWVGEPSLEKANPAIRFFCCVFVSKDEDKTDSISKMSTDQLDVCSAVKYGPTPEEYRLIKFISKAKQFIFQNVINYYFLVR